MISIRGVFPGSELRIAARGRDSGCCFSCSCDCSCKSDWADSKAEGEGGGFGGGDEAIYPFLTSVKGPRNRHMIMNYPSKRREASR